MLKRHSLSEVPKRVSCFTLPMRTNFDFMLKGQSLPIVKKELHVKGAHLPVVQNFNFNVKVPMHRNF